MTRISDSLAAVKSSSFHSLWMNTMNRCTIAQRKLRVGLTTLFFCTSLGGMAPAFAQETVRQFPTAARRATLEVITPPNVLLNGLPERLSPGARIKGPGNLLVLSGNLVGQRVVVNYLRDPQGLVHEVWILNETEAQQKRAGSEPTTNFVFGSDADKPKTDDGKTPFNQLPKFPQQ
jgi:hypothetical protein